MCTLIRRLYIAGPMTGLPKFNIPAFDMQARRLRELGNFEVVSPAELDAPEIRAELLLSADGAPTYPNGHTWGDFLARDVKVIADQVDGIVVLPNWSKSRGARLEVFVALLCGKPVYEDVGFSDRIGFCLRLLANVDIVFAIARSFIA